MDSSGFLPGSFHLHKQTALPFPSQAWSQQNSNIQADEFSLHQEQPWYRELHAGAWWGGSRNDLLLHPNRLRSQYGICDRGCLLCRVINYVFPRTIVRSFWKPESGSPSSHITTVKVSPSSKFLQSCLTQAGRRGPARGWVLGRQCQCWRKHLKTARLFTLLRWGNTHEQILLASGVGVSLVWFCLVVVLLLLLFLHIDFIIRVVRSSNQRKIGFVVKVAFF